MKFFPIALIAIGLLGVAKALGLIPIAMLSLMGPLLLIVLGFVLLLRRPGRCRGNWRARSGPGSASAPHALP